MSISLTLIFSVSVCLCKWYLCTDVIHRDIDFTVSCDNQYSMVHANIQNPSAFASQLRD